MGRYDKIKGDQIWLECPLNTTGIPNGKYEIISFYFKDITGDIGNNGDEFTKYVKVEIDILKDELSDIYLIALSRCTGRINLHFNKDIDLIDIKKLKYLILYDESMGNFVPKLNCISKDKKGIICETDFSGVYHSDKHIVKNIPYEYNYIKAKKFIYFYP